MSDLLVDRVLATADFQLLPDRDYLKSVISTQREKSTRPEYADIQHKINLLCCLGFIFVADTAGWLFSAVGDRPVVGLAFSLSPS